MPPVVAWSRDNLLGWAWLGRKFVIDCLQGWRLKQEGGRKLSGRSRRINEGRQTSLQFERRAYLRLIILLCTTDFPLSMPS